MESHFQFQSHNIAQSLFRKQTPASMGSYGQVRWYKLAIFGVFSLVAANRYLLFGRGKNKLFFSKMDAADLENDQKVSCLEQFLESDLAIIMLIKTTNFWLYGFHFIYNKYVSKSEKFRAISC